MDKKKLDEFFKKHPHLLKSTIPPLRGISTGSLLFDDALGGEGFPIGQISTLFGPSTAGKTTLMLMMARHAVENGKRVLFIDTERRTFAVRLRQIGFLVEEDEKGVEYFDHFQDGFPLMTMVTRKLDAIGNGVAFAGEEIFQEIVDAIESEIYDLIILDSIAMATPQAIMAQEMVKASVVGAAARLNGLFMAKASNALVKNPNCTLLFTNQIYDNVGGFSPTGGTPQVAKGGHSLKFNVVIALKLSPAQQLKPDDGLGQGLMFKFTVAKNNAKATEYGPHEIPLNVTEDGYLLFNTAHEVLHVAKTRGNLFVTKEGEPWSGGNKTACVDYNGERKELPRGADKIIEYLWANEDLLNELVSRIKKG